MKRAVAAFAIGLMLGGAGSALAEFGWTDSGRLERLAKACEEVVVELRGLRQDLRGVRK